MFVPLFRSCLNDDDADDNKKGLTRMTERIICQGKQIENWQKQSRKQKKRNRVRSNLLCIC